MVHRHLHLTEVDRTFNRRNLPQSALTSYRVRFPSQGPVRATTSAGGYETVPVAPFAKKKSETLGYDHSRESVSCSAYSDAFNPTSFQKSTDEIAHSHWV